MCVFWPRRRSRIHVDLSSMIKVFPARTLTISLISPLCTHTHTHVCGRTHTRNPVSLSANTPVLKALSTHLSSTPQTASTRGGVNQPTLARKKYHKEEIPELFNEGQFVSEGGKSLTASENREKKTASPLRACLGRCLDEVAKVRRRKRRDRSVRTTAMSPLWE